MNKFLKCIGCGCESVKILTILTNGSAKTKCGGCGLAFFPEHEKKEKKGPEIFKKNKFINKGLDIMPEQEQLDFIKNEKS